MGSDRIKIRYVRWKRGHWVWCPVRKLLAGGFKPVHLSAGYVVEGVRYMSAADIERARALNDEWDRHRRGLPPLSPRPKYPAGSVGDAYDRATALRAKEREAKRIKWTSEQHSRDDWPRAWRWLEPLFGDADPKLVTPEQMLELRTLVVGKVSESEAHRLIKVWRALWVRMAGFGYCDLNRDPSFQFTNPAPKPRQAVWAEGEAVRLVKQAWRSGYHGLAALLAVAWDSQLSPVDARGLQAGQRRRDRLGTWFQTGRTKTGQSALATLSRRTERILEAYIAKLGAEPVGDGAIFRNSRVCPTRRTRWATTSGPCARWSSGRVRSASSRTSAALAPSRLWQARPRPRTCRPRWRTPVTIQFPARDLRPSATRSVRDADAARQRGQSGA